LKPQKIKNKLNESKILFLNNFICKEGLVYFKKNFTIYLEAVDEKVGRTVGGDEEVGEGDHDVHAGVPGLAG
jgi:hypothetical protein